MLNDRKSTQPSVPCTLAPSASQVCTGQLLHVVTFTGHLAFTRHLQNSSCMQALGLGASIKTSSRIKYRNILESESQGPVGWLTG